MNNRGFAITSILYGLLILFLLVMVSALRMLSSQREMMDTLIDEEGGARDITKIEVIQLSANDFVNGEYVLLTSTSDSKSLIYTHFRDSAFKLPTALCYLFI